MYCSNCGKQIPDKSVYCSHCGKHVIGTNENQDQSNMNWRKPPIMTPPMPSPDPSPVGVSHPYQKLGGWLAFFSFCWAASAVLGVISAIILVSGVSTLGKYLGDSFSTIVIFLDVIILAYAGFGVFCNGKMFLMVKRKDTGFLRFYETIMLITIGLEIVVMLTVKTMLDSIGSVYVAAFMSSFTPSYTSSIVSSVVGVVIMLLYFVNSVRVRTYFGTNEYIRKSLFLKNVTPPEPAVPDSYRY